MVRLVHDTGALEIECSPSGCSSLNRCCAYFISPWCFFILLNLNSVKTVTEINKNEAK